MGVALLGCKSLDQRTAERTARLREMYPPGTTRAEVQAKWGATQPDFCASRPSAGWQAHTNKYVARELMAKEAATGKRIETEVRYWGPDGFLSLCYCFYYFDADGKLVDVQWEYKSD